MMFDNLNADVFQTEQRGCEQHILGCGIAARVFGERDIPFLIFFILSQI